MSLRRTIALTILFLYTVFAVTTFLLSSAYWYAGIYFIVLAIGFFKILKHTKKDEERNVYKTGRNQPNQNTN